MATLQRIAAFDRPTVFGEFHVVCYNHGGNFAYAIVKGEVGVDDLPVRVQSACMFGESFGVNSCDCGPQLVKAMELAAAAERFLVVHLPEQEGRGLGLFQKIKAIEYEVKHAVDMVTAFEQMGLPLDLREYRTAAEIIRDINGDRPVQLYTNNPKKVAGLEEFGVRVSERLPLLVEPHNEPMRKYLLSKKRGMGHILPHVE